MTAWYVMRATGVVSLVLFTAVTVLGIATAGRWRPPRMPRFVTVSLHRNLSLLAVAFVAVHVASALLDRYAGVTPVSVVLPFAAHWNPLFVGLGTVSLDLLAAVVVSSLLRRHLALGTWRGVHFLAYASWPVAVAHSIGAGTDAGTTWLRVLVAACVATVSVAAAWRVSRRNGGRRQLEPREVTG